MEEIAVYARVSPQHKVRIVEALRARGHIVAMTGDGVNDAPALKRADIGIAMGITGTDVSKETAAMVLTDDNYASIVAAVEEGRTIYANIRKFVYYLLSCNMGEILVIFIGTLLGWPLPLTAIQLLVLNLLTDGAPALALGLEKAEPDVMARPPRPPDEPVIDRPMIIGHRDSGDSDLPGGARLPSASACIGSPRTFTMRRPWPSPRCRSRSCCAPTRLARSASISGRSAFGPTTPCSMRSGPRLLIQLAIIYVPILDPVFDTTFLGLRDWLVMLPLILVPSLAAEITKLITNNEEDNLGDMLSSEGHVLRGFRGRRYRHQRGADGDRDGHRQLRRVERRLEPDPYRRGLLGRDHV